MKQRIVVLIAALCAAATFAGAAQAGLVGGNLYWSSGTYASGVTVYLEQQINGSWQTKCQGVFDQQYTFSAPWGYSPCGLLEGVQTRTESAKYLYPSGIICRGWSNVFYWSSTGNFLKNIYFYNC